MRRFLFVFLAIIIAVGVILTGHWQYDCRQRRHVIAQKVIMFQGMKAQLYPRISMFSGGAAVYIKDLTYPKLSLSLQKNRKFAAASLIKVPLMAVIFTAMNEGKLSLDEKIIIEGKDTAGGSGQIKGMFLPIELPVKDLIEYMIEYSDNTAANKFIDLLGFDYVNSKFRQLGLTNTILTRKMMDFSRRRRGVENFTSAADVAKVLEMIYEHSLVNEYYSELALSILTKQTIRDRIPYYLPRNILIAHKTGLENGIVHDAGIIFTAKGDYIICVLTADAVSAAAAKKFIANLSLLTYNLYFNDISNTGNINKHPCIQPWQQRAKLKLAY